MSEGPPKSSAAKPLLIGCGVVAVLMLLCGGVVAYFGAQGFRFVQQEVQRQAEDEAFAQQWQAPTADVPAAAFAPAWVEGYELASSDENAAFPALGVEREGSHAVYEKRSEKIEKESEKIDVSVYRADEAETSAIFDEVVRRIDDDDRFKSHSHVRLPRTLRFSLSDPVDLHGVFWNAGGWLVFVRSETVAELDPFLKAYLTAVEGTQAEGSAEEPAEAETTQEPETAGEG